MRIISWRRSLAAAVVGASIIAAANPAEARHRSHQVRRHLPSMRSHDHGTIVRHPSGCPQVAFCGCGAAVHLFGRPVRDLWLAANWFRFPRSSPGPGMAAVRRHHVMVLERQVSGSAWIVYDANSGHHETRVHVRSIAGWTIVNPRSVRMARG